jgi:hypothetical protein
MKESFSFLSLSCSSCLSLFESLFLKQLDTLHKGYITRNHFKR